MPLPQETPQTDGGRAGRHGCDSGVHLPWTLRNTTKCVLKEKVGDFSLMFSTENYPVIGNWEKDKQLTVPYNIYCLASHRQ